MKTSFPRIAAVAALTALAFAAPAQAASDKVELLRDANKAVSDLRHDPAFSTARSMLDNAKAIYIVPKLIKGGFIFGAEGGDGVLLRRTAKGWGEPRFYGRADRRQELVDRIHAVQRRTDLNGRSHPAQQFVERFALEPG